MNFCKECDKYISLYLDELLDDKSKIEFLKHLEGCSQCAAKLKEASYVADLCREDQGIQLPENFSESLHKRLLEISTKDSNRKFGVFIYNKKLIASLSTAAVLAVSLLAYNLLPQMGLSKDATSMANDTAQVEMANAVSKYSGSSEVKSSILNGTDADSSLTNTQPSDQASASSSAVGDSATNDVNVTIKSNKALSTEESRDNVQSKRSLDKAETSPNSNRSYERKVNDTFCFTMTSENQADTSKYFSNYAELTLQVSAERIEIEDLRKIMKELGAIELEPVTINSIVGNSVESTAETQTEDSTTISVKTPLVGSEYLDYYLSLNSYNTLESQATKYKLKFSKKTDIVKTDITDKYNVLNKQICEINKKIAEVPKNNENISGLEAEKTKLTEEMDELRAGKEMITVRTFLIP